VSPLVRLVQRKRTRPLPLPLPCSALRLPHQVSPKRMSQRGSRTDSTGPLFSLRGPKPGRPVDSIVTVNPSRGRQQLSHGMKAFSPEMSVWNLQKASLPVVKNVGNECDVGAEAAGSTDDPATTAKPITRTAPRESQRLRPWDFAATF
jgi:hypothetical protein